MKNLSFIGIDVSKLVLDVFILSCEYHFKVENSPAGFAQLLEICCDKLDVTREKLYFSFEHTGRYSRLLAVFLEQSEIIFLRSRLWILKLLKALVGEKRIKLTQRILPFMPGERGMN